MNTGKSMQDAILKNTRVVASKNQVSSDVVGEVIILNLMSGLYFGLKDVGAEIWNLVKHPTTVADITAAIVQDYEVDLESCEHDVRALLEELAAEGLIERIKNDTSA